VVARAATEMRIPRKMEHKLNLAPQCEGDSEERRRAKARNKTTLQALAEVAQYCNVRY